MDDMGTWYMSEPAGASVVPKKAIAAVLYTTATKEFNLQYPHLPVGAAGDACAEIKKTQKSDVLRERHGGSRCSCPILSMSSGITGSLNFPHGWRSDRSRGLPRVLVRWYAGGADACRVSAGQKKGYNLVVPKKAMAAASSSRNAHIFRECWGDMGAEEKHINPVLRKRDKGDFNFLTNLLSLCATTASCTVASSQQSDVRRRFPGVLSQWDTGGTTHAGMD
ncbi:hypothetical protein B0H14DRAFT_2584343 [Mycena olivaceomarginata]|nr:hypothetical protein B0H14DRAFT_2584343 [Mycena olivaceomarginata]